MIGHYIVLLWKTFLFDVLSSRNFGMVYGPKQRYNLQKKLFKSDHYNIELSYKLKNQNRFIPFYALKNSSLCFFFIVLEPIVFYPNFIALVFLLITFNSQPCHSTDHSLRTCSYKLCWLSMIISSKPNRSPFILTYQISIYKSIICSI